MCSSSTDDLLQGQSHGCAEHAPRKTKGTVRITEARLSNTSFSWVARWEASVW